MNRNIFSQHLTAQLSQKTIQCSILFSNIIMHKEPQKSCFYTIIIKFY